MGQARKQWQSQQSPLARPVQQAIGYTRVGTARQALANIFGAGLDLSRTALMGLIPALKPLVRVATATGHKTALSRLPERARGVPARAAADERRWTTGSRPREPTAEAGGWVSEDLGESRGPSTDRPPQEDRPGRPLQGPAKPP